MNMTNNNETTMISTGDFFDVKPGDMITRLFYGNEMTLKVAAVDDTLIYAEGGWTFDRATGFEEDAELGMGVAFGVTCSQLIKDKPYGLRR